MKIVKMILCLLAVVFISCNKETSGGITDVDMAVVDRTETSIEISIWVINATQCAYLCLDEAEELTAEDIIAKGTHTYIPGSGYFNAKLTDLEPGTRYHIYVAASNMYSNDSEYLQAMTKSDDSELNTDTNL